MRKILFGLACLLMLFASSQAQTTTSVVNISALTALLPDPNGHVANVAGYYTSGDGGGGQFKWENSDLRTPDYGLVFLKTGQSQATPGRWVRQIAPPSALSVRMFGAKGDGVAQDAAAIQTAINAALNNGFSELKFGGGTFRISGHPDTPQAGQTAFTIDPNDDARYNILHIGNQSASVATFRILGDGAKLYTDQQEFSPNMLSVRASIKDLTISDITFERNVTVDSIGPINAGTGLGEWTSNSGNRNAITLVPHSPTPVDRIALVDVTFIDCHRAVTVAPMPQNDFQSYAGALQSLEITRCSFLYPHGSNSRFANIYSTNQAVAVNSWIDDLEVASCTFDGAIGGDLSSEPSGHNRLPLDGFVIGDPISATIRGNSLRNFHVEGILITSERYIRPVTYSPKQQLVMPNVGADTTIAVPLGRYGVGWWTWMQPGVRLFIGSGTFGKGYDLNGNSVIEAGTEANTALNLGFMELIAAYDPGHASNSTGSDITVILRNTGHPLNPSPGTTVVLANDHDALRFATTTAWGMPSPVGYAQHTAYVTASERINHGIFIIENNVINGRRVVGYGAPAPLGYGSPGIRVDDQRAIIRDNTITECAGGIILNETLHSEGKMAGSIVANNIIKLPAGEQGTGGIALWAAGVSVYGNSIRVPQALEGVMGIQAARRGNNSISENTIIADEKGPIGSNSWGIFVGNQVAGIQIRNNITSNFRWGVGHFLPHDDGSYTVTNHTSLGDITSVKLTSLSTFATSVVGSGNSNQPGLAFGNDPDFNTGIFSDAVGSIGISLNGELVMRFTQGAGQTGNYGQMLMDAGTDDKPGYGFDGDDDTGMYWKGPNQIGFATGGEERAVISDLGVAIGMGNAIKSVKSVNTSLNFGSIAAGTVDTRTVTVTGARTGDAVSLGLPANAPTRLIYSAIVSANDTITVRAFNAGTVIDPDAGDFRIVVIQFGN